jgi:hypothetical protein
LTRLSVQILFAEFAAALSNPIAYQSELEKRAKQLSVLEDDAANDVSAVHSQASSVVNVCRPICSCVFSVWAVDQPQFMSTKLNHYV